MANNFPKNIANSKRRNKNVCVVTNTRLSNTGQVLLSNFLKVLVPISDNLFVITGEFNEEPQNRKIKFFKLNSHEDRRITLKILKYLMSQIKICYKLLKIRHQTDTVIFYINSLGLTIPIVFSKLLEKKFY